MNCNRIKNVIFLLVTLLALTNTIKAQVTIGSRIKPKTGVLLNLQEFEGTIENSNTTATKGLKLPCVELTDLQKLYPMYSKTDTEYSGSEQTEINLIHTGLIVYHVKAEKSTIINGLYIWDGTKWDAIYADSEEETPGSNPDPEGEDGKINDGFVKDHQGYKYPVGDFGDAGWWTLANARPTIFPNGTPIPFSKESDKGNPNWEDLPRIFYPNGNPNSELPAITHKNHYGVLYSWPAAVALETPLDDTTPVRGICPKGWHVPTDADWLKLEKELYSQYPKYSEGITGGVGNWEPYWEDTASEGYRGQFAKVFKSPEKVDRLDNGSGEGQVPPTNGFCKATSDGGFNVMLVGGHNSGEAENQGEYDLHYGVIGQFWSTSYADSNPTMKVVRKFAATDNGASRNKQKQSLLISVRCKQDTED